MIDMARHSTAAVEVSVVMTAYNAETFIRASIAAALAQNHSSYEVILVDDGSTDATAEICGQIADARFRYVRFNRIGRARALNEAVREARGEYIAINDVDDLSLPDRLPYTVAYLKHHPDVALLCTAFTTTDVFRDDASTWAQAVPADAGGEIVTIDACRLYRSNPLVHSTAVFPKHVWSRIGGYDEGLEMCIDYDFFVRALQAGSLVCLPRSTVIYYRNAGSFFKAKSWKRYLRALFLIKKRARMLFDLPAVIRVYDLLVLVRLFVPAARARLSRLLARGGDR
jgi:glycosyltransferase involved in cell wall biosynthesis